MFSSSFFYMFCIKGHIPRTLPNSPSVKISQQTRLEKQLQLCNVFIDITFFYTEANSNKYNNNFLPNLSAHYCISGNVILTLIKLNIYICLFEKFQLLHYCHTENLNQATLTAYYSLVINLPVFPFLIPVGFILGQAEKGLIGGGGVVHIIYFIAGTKYEYNKIAFIDLENNNILLILHSH